MYLCVRGKQTGEKKEKERQHVELKMVKSYLVPDKNSSVTPFEKSNKLLSEFKCFLFKIVKAHTPFGRTFEKHIGYFLN